jgi:hypothetical protein
MSLTEPMVIEHNNSRLFTAALDSFALDEELTE